MNFSQYLEEGRDAPLYHGTNMDNASRIVYRNYMYGTRSSATEPIGISTTRSLQTAFKFAKERHDEDDVVVFEFNQRKLNFKYKITPFNFHDTETRRVTGHWNEYEEKIVAERIDVIDRYITKIIVKEIGIVKDYPILYNHPLLYESKTKKWVNK